MSRSARLVLIGHVSGLSGVASLDAFVCITLNLVSGLLARCGLLLLRHCRERDRASGNDNRREN